MHTITDSSTAEYSSVLDYRDVCIAYHTGTSRRGRQQPKAGAGKARWPQSQQLISLRHAGGDPATALSVLMGFSEYTLNYHELLVTRPAANDSRGDEAEYLRSKCARRRFGFAIPMSFNNVFHAIFHAVPALDRFRERADTTLLYVHRDTPTRSVSNEAALHAGLRESCAARRVRLRRVVLDAMPLTEQMRAVANADILVAAFGQALTWMILLPPPIAAISAAATPEGVGGDARRIGGSAVVELAPRDAFWKKDYEILARVLGLRYRRVYGVTSACLPQPTRKVKWQQRLSDLSRWLTCNFTMNVSLAVEAVHAI